MNFTDEFVGHVLSLDQASNIKSYHHDHGKYVDLLYTTIFSGANTTNTCNWSFISLIAQRNMQLSMHFHKLILVAL